MAGMRANPEVEQFLRGLNHPLQREVEAVREIVGRAAPELTEHIKWNAPSFCWNGEDRITFHLRGKADVQLVFHRGAKRKADIGRATLIEDGTGWLKWAAPDRATVKFAGMDDVLTRQQQLADIVVRWIEAARE